MDPRLPLPSLLSQALVAYTVEFDNEFERLVPHRTTNHGSTGGGAKAPWLVSMVMWTSCMQFVPADGVRVHDFRRSAWWFTTKGATTLLKRMGEWWGYLEVGPDPSDARGKVPFADWLITTTRGGAKAQEVWRPLGQVIDDRWSERFGTDQIGELREALVALTQQLGRALPGCLPVFEFDFSGAAPNPPEPSGPSPALSALLAKVLLAFDLDCEPDSSVPLEIGSNVLRVLGDTGVRVRDLPSLTGTAKESVAVSLKTLERKKLAVVGSDPAGGRSKVVTLTARGQAAQEKYHRLLETVETRWRKHYGAGAVDALRSALVGLDDEGLFAGYAPYPDGWRSSLSRPATFPHYPVISHRGGFPDGS